MKKLYYALGAFACFVVLAALTFLFPKCYESKFVIVEEFEKAPSHNRVINLQQNANYDLGLVNPQSAFDMYAYREVIKSDQFIRPLLSMRVRTLDGKFDGTFTEYISTYTKKAPLDFVLSLFKSKKKQDGQGIVNTDAPWTSIQQEGIAASLKKSIDIEVDYETRFVTITCVSQDPLVSRMMAQAINDALLRYVADYQQARMQNVLSQLEQEVASALHAYELDPNPEKQLIYESLTRQAVVYKAQMMYVPSYTILSEPSFSYKKVSPSRWKMPLVITFLIGMGIVVWKYREDIFEYIKG